MGTIKRAFANNILTSGKLNATDLSGTIPASNIDNTTVSAVTALPSAVGDAIESTATDPVSPTEGQIWYNSSEGKLKIYGLVAAVWSSGGNLNTTRYALSGAGTQTANLVFGGQTGIPQASRVANTESYNGSSWTAVTAMTTARRQIGPFGIQTAALGAGGYTTNETNIVESWNGTSWTSSPSLPGNKRAAASAGTQTAGILFGGEPGGGPTATTESWNGSTWTSVNSMNTARAALQGGQSGTQTAALAFGGAVGPANSGATESWSGTSWTTVTSMTTARQSLAHGGNQTAALGSGGYIGAGSGTNATESFTGSYLSNKNVTIS